MMILILFGCNYLKSYHLFTCYYSPGGYLDPETGMWVVDSKKHSRSSSPERKGYQVSSMQYCKYT